MLSDDFDQILRFHPHRRCIFIRMNTAPVFWGMFGLGMAVNRMLVTKENLFVKAEDTQTTENDNAEVQQKNDAAPVNESVKAENKNGKQKASSKKQSRKQRKNQKK